MSVQEVILYNINTLHPPPAGPADSLLLSHLDSLVIEDGLGLYNLEDNSGHYVIESDSGSLGTLLQSTGDKILQS